MSEFSGRIVCFSVAATAAVLSMLALPNFVLADRFQGNRVQLTAIEFLDQGQGLEETGDFLIDTTQNNCGTAPNFTPEPFFDTFVAFSIRNESNFDLRVRNFRVTVNNADGSRKAYRSLAHPVSSSFTAPGGDGLTTKFLGVFLLGSGGRKSFPSFGAVPTELGIRNVTVEVNLVDGKGRTLRLKGRVATGFRDVNRCGN